MTLADGSIRPVYGKIARWLASTPAGVLAARRSQAELLFRRIGITFAVYGEGEQDGAERLIPFDIIPRMMLRSEWTRLEAGLVQRVKALNQFLSDIYGAREIVKAGRIPADLVASNAEFRPEMVGWRVPHDIYVHIAGIDVVRTGEDDFYVLEDNVRTPSGVSYMLENREVMMRVAPDLFADHRVAPVENYPDSLLNALRSLAPPAAAGEPTIVVLTPGRFNSAYYEHSFLADKLGVELVEGGDLLVENDVVYMRTTQGEKRVDVIYRRIDDAFLDPRAFKPESIIGVAGLMDAYRAGNVTLTNAVGTGIADDKAIYTYVPDIIDFYLGEKAILNNVPTWRCREPDALLYVREHLPELVVKEVNGSGGYGMLVGPHASKSQIEVFAEKLARDPSNFIAQPTLALSTTPTLCDAGIAPRHVDLRPFVLTGTNGMRVMPGGLTRVALKEKSLVVNSSQGGGTKDTWIVEDSIFDDFSAARGQTRIM
ncbi:MAG TPA: circularly permuted type 2 ATP-grasp protein [Methylocella sp.]|nr:circularly permuted type 2 ATP-grasp protein [Methylocella sp.]